MIEQFAYKVAPDTEKADEAIDKYSSTLPSDFMARFPSLGDIYSTLSEDIHKATGSPKVFEDERKKIVKHFEARNLYELK